MHLELAARGWVSDAVALEPGSSERGQPIEPLTQQPPGLSTLRALRRKAVHFDVVVAYGSTTLPASALALIGSTPFIYVNIGDPRAWQTTVSRRLRTRAFLTRASAVAAISPTAATILDEWVRVPRDRIRGASQLP